MFAGIALGPSEKLGRHVACSGRQRHRCAAPAAVRRVVWSGQLVPACCGGRPRRRLSGCRRAVRVRLPRWPRRRRVLRAFWPGRTRLRPSARRGRAVGVAGLCECGGLPRARSAAARAARAREKPANAAYSVPAMRSRLLVNRSSACCGRPVHRSDHASTPSSSNSSPGVSWRSRRSSSESRATAASSLPRATSSATRSEWRNASGLAHCAGGGRVDDVCRLVDLPVEPECDCKVCTQDRGAGTCRGSTVGLSRVLGQRLARSPRAGRRHAGGRPDAGPPASRRRSGRAQGARWPTPSRRARRLVRGPVSRSSRSAIPPRRAVRRYRVTSGRTELTSTARLMHSPASRMRPALRSVWANCSKACTSSSVGRPSASQISTARVAWNKPAALSPRRPRSDLPVDAVRRRTTGAASRAAPSPRRGARWPVRGAPTW